MPVLRSSIAPGEPERRTTTAEGGQNAEFRMHPELGHGSRGLMRIKALSRPSTLRSGASPIANQGCAATEDGQPSVSSVVTFCGIRNADCSMSV